MKKFLKIAKSMKPKKFRNNFLEGEAEGAIAWIKDEITTSQYVEALGKLSILKTTYGGMATYRVANVLRNLYRNKKLKIELL